MASKPTSTATPGRPGSVKAQQTGLLSLPREILHLICAKLCYHCRFQDIVIFEKTLDRSYMNYGTGLEERQALCALNLTSRQLRQVAQEAQCHLLITHHYPGSSLRIRLLTCLRFLKSRKDLRVACKSIIIDGTNLQCHCCLPDIIDGASPEERVFLQRRARETGLPLLPGSFDGERINETMTEILISMLPALTDVHLEYPGAWTFENLAAWRYKGVALGAQPTAFLNSLRHLELVLEPHDHDGCGPENDTCGEDPGNTAFEQLLIEASPNVKALSCSPGGLADSARLVHVRLLEIQLNGRWGHVPRIVEAMPSLERLEYTSWADSCRTAREFREALAPIVEGRRIQANHMPIFG